MNRSVIVTPENLSQWDHITDETIAQDIEDTRREYALSNEMVEMIGRFNTTTLTIRARMVLEQEKQVQAERLDFIAALEKMQQLRKDRAAGNG